MKSFRGFNKKGAARPPVTPQTPVEDPEAKKKREETAAREASRLQSKRGMGRTIATGPMGVLGAAPINKPELKGSLG